MLKPVVINKKTKTTFALLLSVLLIVTSFTTFLGLTSADATGQLTNAYVKLSDSVPNDHTVTYTMGFKPGSSYTAQCVTIVFSTATTNATKPTGMSTTASSKGTFSGLTDGSWTSYASAADGTIQLEYGTGQAVTTGTTAVLPINGINNPSSAATYYATITTYDTLTTHSCSGPRDTIVVAFATTAGITASVTVDSSLTFAVNSQGTGVGVSQTGTDTSTVITTATTIPFGHLAANTVAVAAQQLQVSTNAQNGYTIYASSSGALNDGLGHTIADWTGSNATPSTLAASTSVSKFGYTSHSQTLSGSATRFNGDLYAGFTLTGAEIAGNAASPGPVDTQNTIVGYKVNVSNTQQAGTYTTNIGLVATPTY